MPVLPSGVAAPAVSNVAEILRRRAQQAPSRRAFTFLRDGDEESEQLSYGELDLGARRLATHLRQGGFAGQPVLLLFPPGLGFVEAFFGCLAAGVLAVPAYPPRANRRGLGRLEAILRDCQPRLALGPGELIDRLRPRAARMELFSELEWLAIDRLEGSAPDLLSAVDASVPAFLQYTSGSTSTPKGVVVTHANLLHNEAMITEAIAHGESSVMVSWLPFYHDMGLIGNVVQPIYSGGSGVLMSPRAFLQQPARWLRAVDRYGATTSGGPNFAYELCTRRIPEESLADLDLSRWRVAFNGAEPVRAGTLERFAERFAPCGFRPEAFFPCYGMAETTLFVTGLDREAAPRTAAIEGRQLVSCGAIGAGQQEVVIADPESCQDLPDGEVGEIWIRGASVADGYWGRPETTAEIFGARLADGRGPFLRTGDLGAVVDGELYISGRIKDLLIVRGRNLYPQDLELAAERAHAALRPDGGAAFAVPADVQEDDGEERLVVVHEVERRADLDAEDVARAVRRQLAEEHEVHVADVVLIRTGTLLKTSSGKVRRRACREAYLAGELRVVGRSAAPAPTEVVEVARLGPEALADLTPEDRQRLVEGTLRERVAALLGVEPSKLGEVARSSLAGAGLDSLRAVELQHGLERDLGTSLPLAELLEAPDLATLAARLAEAIDDGTLEGSSARPGGWPAGEAHPLSRGQQALWFLERLAPTAGAYNLVAAASWAGETALDAAALRRAAEGLVARHPALRTTFAEAAGRPMQVVSAIESALVDFLEIDAGLVDDLETWLAEEAYRPFDLENGPLLRVRVVRESSSAPDTKAPDTVLVSVHHLVSDFWSLALLLEEWGVLYRAALQSAGQNADAAEIEEPELSYLDWLSWQEDLLTSPRGEALWTSRKQRLAGLPALELPIDRRRPAVQTFAGATVRRRLPAAAHDAFDALARQHGATFYTALLAVLQAVLQRWSGQNDFALGSPTAGRGTPRLADVVGYFVNPLVLRAKLGGDPSFATLVERARRAVLDAFTHQDLPFALLAERLHPTRDASRTPLFQVLFSLQRPPRGGSEALSALALGEAAEGAIEAGGLRLRPRAFPARRAPFELTLMAAELDGALVLSAQYNTDLFDAATAERLLGWLDTLFHGAVEDPATPISRLPLLTRAERHELLETWNATGVEVPAATVHGVIAEQAQDDPEAPAILFEGQTWTRGALHTRASRIARHLRQQGVVPGDLVGVRMQRSPDMVAALLGVLQTGAAYLPLDPSYPEERLRHMVEDSRVRLVLDSTLDLDEGASTFCNEEPGRIPQSTAYVIYTSGSTGRPKGVVIPHRAVINFFAGMDAAVGCGPRDVVLATTAISFDISVLELFWTLSRGATVALLGEDALTGGAPAKQQTTEAARPSRALDLSLFYFASSDAGPGHDKYHLLLEGARFADRHGLAAVWTPERHFHAFGGLYANPAISGAAVAAITENVAIRAGSVVMPLHDPIRVAEEWSMVDNLSNGRVGLAFASGWHADDFVFFPEKFDDRKEVMARDLETVRHLWRGGTIERQGGGGNAVEVRVLPRPVQDELPVWITAAGAPETFAHAGRLGANVLTHLLGQSFEEVGEKVRAYRAARAEAGHAPDSGTVTLMLHTFLGVSRDAVREVVREPFTGYLRSSVGLIRNLAKSLGLSLDLDAMAPADMDALLAHAFDRYFETSALFGTVEDALAIAAKASEIGVDEIACLVDFGVGEGDVVASLPALGELARELAKPSVSTEPSPPAPLPGGEGSRSWSFAEAVAQLRPTLFQTTPSALRLLAHDPHNLEALDGLGSLLLGGESLPPDLARTVRELLPSTRLVNVYGPTETTIWSATDEVAMPDTDAVIVAVGRPIANTTIHVLSPALELVPAGSPGELWIGGDGLADGYLRRPALTAERFVPDPFTTSPGARLYRTGDLARRRPDDGRLEILGRTDRQVKIRGFRVELEEIEAVLTADPAVAEAAVLVRGEGEVARLVAYVVPPKGSKPDAEALRDVLATRLPGHMVPGDFVALERLPRTPNGKLDRAELGRKEATAGKLRSAVFVAPRNRLERQVAEIWRQVLGVERVGADDNFFDLGGHSLLMAQAHARLRDELGTDLPLVKMLEHPTVGALARVLASDGSEGFSVEKSHDRAARQLEARRRRQRHQRRPRPRGRR